jgi:cytosine/adenosine deaminase-related metal-dependent hydrolase
MTIISADYIFTGVGEPLTDHAIILEKDGTIIDIVNVDKIDTSNIEFHKGALTPGFINAHCHLELSHMKGLIPTGTGLTEFIKRVVSQREFASEVIYDAIKQADKEMWEEGIVAVGDISNMLHTLDTKSTSRILYYTFVECFDLFQPSMTDQHMKGYISNYRSFSSLPQGRTNLTPHAPYSVSPNMFREIRNNNPVDITVSLHNQETLSENLFFIDNTGDLPEFYKFVNLPLNDFAPIGKRSINYALPQLNPEHKTLLVHNTVSDREDIRFAHDWSENVYWCTCPNANLYIENKLPDYSIFTNENARMCLGTDSLSSNWQLSILEEMKTILKYQSETKLVDLISWATYNGAQALGFEHTMGSIEVGKRPGINLMDLDVVNDRIPNNSKVKKLI